MCDTCGCKKAESFEADSEESNVLRQIKEIIQDPSDLNTHEAFERIKYLMEEHGFATESFEAEVDIQHIKDLGKSFDDDDGLPEDTYSATWSLINEGMGPNTANEWSRAVDATDGKFYLQEPYDFGLPPYDAESFEAEYSVDKLSKMSFREIDRKSGFLGDMLANLGVMDSWTELSKSKRKEILNKIKKKESWLGWDAEKKKIYKITQDDMDAESFDADFDNAPYDSFDEAMSDNVSFPEKEYEIDDRDIYNPERAAMDMIRSNRALREQMEEQGVYVGRHPGYYDDNGQWVELMEHYDDYERIPNWLQGLVGVGLVGGLTYLLTKISGSTTDAGNNTTESTE